MKRILLFAIFTCFTYPIFAQQNIAEGKIVYDIFFTEKNDLQQKGQLVITLKNNILKREMKVDGLIINTIIYDGNTGESKVYSDVSGNKLMKAMTKLDLQLQNKRFENASYKYSSETKNIISTAATKVNITYQDGTNNTVYYSENFKVSMPEFYNMFSALKGFPMQYEVATKSNKIVLVVKSIEAVPISTEELEAPKGYKKFNFEKAP